MQLLQPWSVNTGQRVIRTPKIYLNDTGLLAHMLGLTFERLELDAGMAGGVLENFVLMELRKQASWSETQPQFFYWRTASGQEVDIVLENSAGSLVGVEVKASATLNSGDVRGLQALASAAGRRWIRGVVLYAGTDVVPFAGNLHGVPVCPTSGERTRKVRLPSPPPLFPFVSISYKPRNYQHMSLTATDGR